MRLQVRHDGGDGRPGPDGAGGILRRGFVLVAVLVILMLASMVAMSLLFRIKAEQTATSASQGSDQAWATAMSGVREAMRVAREAAGRGAAQGGIGGAAEGAGAGGVAVEASTWEDNPRAFRERLIYDDAGERWSFTVYSPALDETGTEPRYGLTDEAGKLNINQAHQAGMEKIPGLSGPLAQAMRDYIDPDNAERPDGAEQEYYRALPRPYAIRNGPLDSLDELLMVRGFTPGLLYGEDANMNFRLDLNEDDGEERPPMDNKDGRLNLGLRRHLTVWSYEYDNAPDGNPRVNVNNPKAGLPPVPLPEGLTNYIAALREAKGKIRHAADLLEAKGRFKDSAGREAEVASGVGPDQLAVVLDYLCGTDEATVPGLVNVNTASSAVLQTVPGLDEALVDSILGTRQAISPERRRNLAWLVQERVLDAAKFREVAPHLTARGYQFSFRVVGFGQPSGRYCVLDVVIDVGDTEPAILYLRDLTRFGMPFRVGENPTTVAQAQPHG